MLAVKVTRGMGASRPAAAWPARRGSITAASLEGRPSAMLRRLVIIVVIVGVAGLVVLLSRNEAGGSDAGDVLRGAPRDGSAPSFATDAPAGRGAAAPTELTPITPAANRSDDELRITVLHS